MSAAVTSNDLDAQICTLWVHNEAFSKEDVLLNTSSLPKGLVAGKVLKLTPYVAHVGVRDFQAPVSASLSASKAGHSGAASFAGNGRQNGRAKRQRLLGRERRAKCFTFASIDMDAELKTKHPNLQISVSERIGQLFDFRNKMLVNVETVSENQYAAGHVEIIFRDVYLARADMWKMVVTEMNGKGVYQGQQVVFLGTIKATVRNIYIRGRRVPSAYFANTTRPIFRSESARFVLYIQMSREMWDFDTEGTGGIMRSKVINGFLPELFKRWVKMNARHLVSIVLFTRVEYEAKHPVGNQPYAIDHHGRTYRDFYRVVVSEMDSGEWTTILYQLKAEFNLFLRDILLTPTTAKDHDARILNSAVRLTEDAVIAGRPSSSLHGNVLEAINLASSQFAEDHIDRDLVRTGLSIVIITPGTGVFEVDAEMLRLTTENLVSNGVGIDIICLASMPLHSVPLFKYRAPESTDTTQEANPVASPYSSRLTFIDTGSFGNQSLRSESSITSRMSSHPAGSYITTMLGSGREWIYAMPHWIDVSFWTSSPHERHRTARKVRMTWKSKYNAAAIFRPRCRMYELQMMGLMETEMSNISIPYLHDTTPEVAINMLKQRKDTLAPGLSQSVRSPTLSAIVPGSATLRSREHRHISREDREEYRWMDRHDERLFKVDTKLQAGKPETIRRLSLVNGMGAQRPSNRTTSSTDFGLSKLGHSPSSMGPVSGSFLDQTMIRRRQEESRKDRRRSNADTIKSVNSISHRPPVPRLSTFGSLRLGFGLQGLSKAAATTGATTEFASFGPALFRKPDERENIITPVKPSIAGQVRASLSRTASSASLQTIKGPRASKAISIQLSPKLSVHPMDDIEPLQLEHEDAVKSRQLLSKDSYSQPPQPRRTESQLKTLSEQKSHPDDHDPWLTILNPSNPRKNNSTKANRFRRWQHLFPRPPRKSAIKWKSLCAPAALPLTNEDFPSLEELRNEYQERPYRIALSEDDDMSEHPRDRSDLIRELVAFRLSHGFQIVVGSSVAAVDGQVSNVFDENFMGQDGAQIFMSKGNDIHQLSCILGSAVQITRFQRRRKTANSPAITEATLYKPLIKYALGKYYEARPITISPSKELVNWSYIDNFIAGYNDDFSETLRFWRARFVLIPVDIPTMSRKHVHVATEDSDEEVRIEGIEKLTQMWQRNRFIPPDERYFHADFNKKLDPNPLAIEYQTRDPSVFLSLGLENSPLIDVGEFVQSSSGLVAEAELYRTMNIDLHKLAMDLQSDKGVRMHDRRWHFRMHPNCFLGSDLTSWLLSRFKDIDSRDDASELGTQLMQRGLFQHVQKKHRFRDGNYFYEISNEYKAVRPESRSSWFGSTKKPERSVPSTPVLGPAKDSSLFPSRTALEESTHEVKKSAHSEPKKSSVSLSAVMQYDLDPRGKSYRPEVINLHYDRLHHPDNCYHIRIEWMNVTAKLIEDAIVIWATSVERYGLKLVEVPIAEASSISNRHPFRSPYIVELALQPPDTVPSPHPHLHEGNGTSTHAYNFRDPHVYHKALLRRLDFVLDLESASSFPTDLKVKYSWGKPDYHYTQYIHKSGVVLAQITDDGNFLMLANRLCNYRAASTKDATKFSAASATSHPLDGILPTTTTSSRPVTATKQPPQAPHQLKQRPLSTSNISDRTAQSPFSSPLVRAVPDHFPNLAPPPAPLTTSPDDHIRINIWRDQLKDEIEAYCSDPDWLAGFYDEISRAPALSLGEFVTGAGAGAGGGGSLSAKNTPVLGATVLKVGVPDSGEGVLGASAS